MKINCIELRDTIADKIKSDVVLLKKRGITPYFAIIQVGNYPPSDTYVHVKMKKAKELGIDAKLYKFNSRIPKISLVALISRLNSDPSVHGIIIQRPLPPDMDETYLQSLIDPQKDIDGFSPNSPFKNPLVAAVEHVLNYVLSQFSFHLRTTDGACPAEGGILRTTVIGKGRTAGGPIYDYFSSHPIILISPHVIPAKAGILLDVKQIDSKTKNPDEILKSADIIISCVGKPRIIRADNIKKGVVLISVGQHQESNHTINPTVETLHATSLHEKQQWLGDYNESDIKNISSFYTPTPKGIGPLNVIYLLNNIIIATNRVYGTSR